MSRKLILAKLTFHVIQNHHFLSCRLDLKQSLFFQLIMNLHQLFLNIYIVALVFQHKKQKSEIPLVVFDKGRNTQRLSKNNYPILVEKENTNSFYSLFSFEVLLNRNRTKRYFGMLCKKCAKGKYSKLPWSFIS